MADRSTEGGVNGDEDGDEDREDRPPETVRAAVVTITANGSLDEDPAGDDVVAAFEDGGHAVSTRELIAKDHDNVQSKVSRLVDRRDVDVVVTVGGTGVEPTDVTLEAVRPLLDKDLPAFVGLFHWLSYEEIGTGVVTRRALGGVADGVAVFCLPYDAETARLACEEIVVPEAPRLATLANGDGDGDGDEDGDDESA
ncbi:MogA/MoaB family molybdenum cofactor biosynthesis protein [Salinilacihabitans rarus]|uniref:MogA/MoaB family molybdenum cofactor biosynthesis protein n=1 Tax=Salinilacihabitans rarus TaxID=2961596 RepID=UPI0020C8E7C0|nr:molybdopterin-binding protein [Salinilacihabitans rarus]